MGGIFPSGHALIVGVDMLVHAPAYKLVNVSAVEQIAQALSRPDRSGYPAEQCTLLRGTEATYARTIQALDALAAKVTPDDIVLIYYCGPAVQTDERYTLILQDSGLPNKASAPGLVLTELLDSIVSLQARRVLLLLDIVLPEPVDGFALTYPSREEFAAFVTSGTQRMVITAGQAEQLGREDTDTSMFARALARGLSGLGDNLVNIAGQIGAFNLYEQIYYDVQESIAGQEPQLLLSATNEDVAVALFRGTSSPGEFKPMRYPRDAAVHEIRSSDRATQTSQETVEYGDSTLVDVAQTTGTIKDSQIGGRDAVGGNQVHAGRDAAGRDFNRIKGDQVHGTKIGTQHNYYEKPDEDIVPTPPPPDSNYINREETEQLLAKSLLADDDQRPITLLWSPSKSGKSWLAQHIAYTLFTKEQAFPGGVVYVPLNDEKSVAQIQHYVLKRCGRKWSDVDHNELDAPMFWQKLNDRYEQEGPDKLRERRILIILDNVRDAQQLKSLQPDRPTRSRLLAICHHDIDDPELLISATAHITLQQFSDQQTQALFRRVLGDALVAGQEGVITQLAERIGRHPERLMRAAQTIAADKKLSPYRYLKQREREQEETGIAADLILDQDLNALGELSTELFALSSLLGAGSWSAEMIGAMTLASSSQIASALNVLARRNLIGVEGKRYQMRYLDDARQLLRQRSPYEQQIAPRLLARFCLDLVQDAAKRINARLYLDNLSSADTYENYTFVKQFQQEVADELPHLRTVLERLVQFKEWDLLRRFAYVPYLGLLQWGTGSSSALAIEQWMATIDTLHLAYHRYENKLSVYTIAPSPGGYLVQPEGDSVGSVSSARMQEVQAQLAQNGSERQELILKLTACQVRGLFITESDLIDCKFVGVHATGSVWRDVELVGAELRACDLTRSIWYECRAAHANFEASNLSYAVMRKTNLRGADLSGVDLTGALLDRVDLRRAKLNGAKLMGAVFNQVDLRGAVIDEASWQGSIGISLFCDPTVEDEIAAEAAQTPSIPINQPYGWRWLDRDVSTYVPPIFTGQFQAPDLRAAQLQGATFSGIVMPGADFTAADLQGATFSGRPAEDTADESKQLLVSADLQQAHFFAANLQGAVFNWVNLNNANFAAAALQGAVFDECTLRDVNFTGALLQGASLRQVDLTGALLRQADLRGANLSSAICKSVNFTAALVDDATLTRAATLAHSTLPSGESVLTYDGTLRNTRLTWDIPTLRFPEFSGIFEQVEFQNLDANFARLTGTFRSCAFKTARIESATVSGLFESSPLFTVAFHTCRVNGVFKSSPWFNTALTGCKLDGTFETSPWFNTALTGCKLDGTFETSPWFNTALTGCKLDGTFETSPWFNTALTGCKLDGTFESNSFNTGEMDDTVIDGSMQHVEFFNIQFSRCRLEGSFDSVIFVQCHFGESTSLKGAFQQISYLFSRFDDGLEPVAAIRLYGSTFSNGSLYDGHLALPGDLADARFLGIDLTDTKAMGIFYAAPPVSFAQSRQRLDGLRIMLAELPLSVYKTAEQVVNLLQKELDRFNGSSLPTNIRDVVATTLEEAEQWLLELLANNQIAFANAAREVAYSIRKLTLRHIRLDDQTPLLEAQAEEGENSDAARVAN